MFTGIIRAVGSITNSALKDDLMQLSVTTPAGFSVGLSGGESISVDGVCLTVVEVIGDELTFDVIQETVKLTTLGSATQGAKLNLERSLKFGEEVGGLQLTSPPCTSILYTLLQQVVRRTATALGARRRRVTLTAAQTMFE